jgi:uncharacterized protein YcbK (DUF882 family)
VTERLIEALDLLHGALRKYAGNEAEIYRLTSGFRCLTYNRVIGSKDSSYHCRGMAVDLAPICIDKRKIIEVAKTVPAFMNGGIGEYQGNVHLDVRRDGPARWTER